MNLRQLLYIPGLWRKKLLMTVWFLFCNFSFCFSDVSDTGPLEVTPKMRPQEVPRLMGNLTLCAMVRDEMPYIVEWIEFYRLQGVDHFILYDDGSFDDTVLLGDLYKTADLEDLVEIVPTNPYRRNQPYTHSYHHYTQTQVYVLDHCNKRSINRSQWIIVVDVDEFIHSPPHGSIWNFIESKKSQTELSDSNQVGDALSQFYIEAVRYGSLGIEKNFRGHLHKDPYHGTLALDTEVHPNYTDQDEGGPLIIRANPNRAPKEGLDADYGEQYDKICKSHRRPNGCIHANGKSIWKPERCGQAYVHWCQKGLQGRSETPSVKEIRENHYAFKSREHVMGLIDMMRPIKKEAYDDFDQVWFSSRRDPMDQATVEAVQLAVAKFHLPDNLKPLKISTFSEVDFEKAKAD